MRIAILGMGRLGKTMAGLLKAAGWDVATWRRGEVMPRCAVAWITVSDDAVAQVARALPPGPIVLHASGSLDVDVLRPHRPAGSLHPLQTFPGPQRLVPDLRGVPAAVSGDEEAIRIAIQIARSLEMSPVRVGGDRRLYHAACVMAGNFSTVLLDAALTLLDSAGLERDQGLDLLAPLVRSSLGNSLRDGPGAALTGPYSRGDTQTMAAHREAIRLKHPELLALYDALAHQASELAARGHPSRIPESR